MKIVLSIIIIIAIAALAFFLFSGGNDPGAPGCKIDISEAMAGNDSGYSKALAPVDFKFPEDYGAHPGFRTEWWYYTGNLFTENGLRFGFQFTIFRHSLSADSARGKSAWAVNNIYMGHFAISDIENDEFYYFERINRETPGYAYASAKPFIVKIGDWRIEGSFQGDTLLPEMRISAAEKDISIDITLIPEKPMALHGIKGLSPKSSQPGNASYYYSFTDLKAAGTIAINGESHKVSGKAWMDREWSTSALSQRQSGWDWFSVKLDKGYDLMYFQIRGADNRSVDFAKGTLIYPDGSTEMIKMQDAYAEALEYWDSPLGGRYPVKWKITIPKKDILLETSAVINKQEMDLSLRYWEGAIDVKGTWGGERTTGMGYLEMTGY
ncbi:MAG: lipocalin-like domain-containing protein [Candidatus Kapaibacterium sp.]